MRRQRAEVVVLLAMISVPFVIGLPVSFARTRKPALKKIEEVPAQPTPDLETEIAALRQQLEEHQQVIRSLRGQFEERRVAAEALAARLDERRATEEALAAQLTQLRQDTQRQQHILYRALGAGIIFGVGLVGVGWVLRRRGAVPERGAILDGKRNR